MANRTTVKSNIDVLNVPSVSNADLGQMLKDNICDNVVFKEDVAAIQTSTSSTITCNFTAKDRIDLTRNGGSLNISVSGIADGQTVHLLINKTAGQVVTFVGVTDVTPVSADVTALSRVLYEIIRKNNYYYARAWVAVGAATTARAGVLPVATQAQMNALTATNVIATPGYMPRMSTSQRGLCEAADDAQIDTGTDMEGSDPLVVVPSQLLRKLTQVYSYIADEVLFKQAWISLSLGTGWTNGGVGLKYTKDKLGFVHLIGDVIKSSTSEVFAITTLPVGYRPLYTLTIIAPIYRYGSVNDWQNELHAVIQIQSTGVVSLINQNDFDNDNYNISFDNISFRDS